MSLQLCIAEQLLHASAKAMAVMKVCLLPDSAQASHLHNNGALEYAADGASWQEGVRLPNLNF